MGSGGCCHGDGFRATSVVNYQTMVRLVDTEETEIVAHRGFIAGGVENTLPALQAAAKAGADRVEFDVMETKDGKFVVMHDANLQRLAGKNLNVKDLTQDELTKITVRADGMEAKIPSLEEWIQLSIQLNLPQLLEIKLHGGETPDLVPRLLAVLDHAGVTESYTYHTLSREVVDELKRLRPELVVGFIVPINFGGIPKVKADFLGHRTAVLQQPVHPSGLGGGLQRDRLDCGRRAADAAIRQRGGRRHYH